MSAPCDWPVSYVACGGVGDAYDPWGEGIDDLDERAAAIAEAQSVFEQLAVENLWNLTGHVFGTCPVEVRPCRSDCGDSRESTFWGGGPFPAGRSPWQPVLIDGQWHNITCGCADSCTCALDGTRTLALPGPVGEITEVWLDGTLIPATAYRVEYGRRLLRTDGGTWPSCQDLNALPDEAGAFAVRYTRGVAVPLGGQAAAGALALELAKAACGDDDCALPDYVQTLTRQGLSVTIGDDAAGGTSSKPTGVRSVDQWILSVTKPRPRAGVRSVDIPKDRVGGVAWRR